MSKDVVATLVLPDDRSLPDGPADDGPRAPSAPSRARRILLPVAVLGLLLLAATRLGPDPAPAPVTDVERAHTAVAVTATDAEPGPDGSVDVDLTNVGALSITAVGRLGNLAGLLRLMGDPSLPLDLAPGETRRIRITVVLTACPGPGPAAVNDQLGLEARSSVGWAMVGNSPGSELGRGLATAVASANRAQCGR